MNTSKLNDPEQQPAVSFTQQLAALEQRTPTQENASEADEALDDLNFTLSQVKLCSEKPERCAAELTALCAELESDTLALEEAAPDVAARSPQIKDTLKQARRTQRIVHREALSLANAASAAKTVKTEQPPPPIAPKQSLKINRVKLPTFDGDAVKYRHFRNAFRENIEQNEELTDTTRWIHLRESLKGTAAELISEIPETSKDLRSALQLLDATYGQEKRVTLHLFQRIYQLPSATADTTKLRLIQAKLEGLLASLENAGHPVNSDPHLQLIAASKFPIEILHQLTQGKELSMAELRTQLHCYITARENLSAQILQVAPHSSTSAATPQAPTAANTRNAPRTSRASIQKPVTCIFCKGPHFSDTCPVYTTVDTRKKQIADRCVRCFRQTHEGACGSERRCVYCDSKDHNRALCPKKFAAAVNQQTTLYASADQLKINADGVFWTLRIWVSSAAAPTPIEVRAVIDSGGAKTMVTSSLARRLKLVAANQEPIKMQSLGQTSLPPAVRAKNNLILHPPNDVVIDIPAHITSSIADDLPAASISNFRQLYPQYAHLNIPETGAGEPIELLFGKDTLLSILTLEKSITINRTHQLLATKLGHIIVTNEADACRPSPVAQLSFNTANDFQQMWDLNAIGLKFTEDSDVDNESQALKKFYSTIEFKDGRYYVGLPYESEPPLIDEGFGLAWGRLKTLWLKLRHHQHLLTAYDDIIKEQHDNQIIEPVARRSTNPDAVLHYVPHHPVIRPDSATTKIRIVYDASAGATPHKKSLNQTLLKGTSWVEELFAILLRFRRYPTALLADITKAFLQIGIQEPYRDAVRFLWLRDVTQPPTLENIKIFRFTRIAFGIISSPFLLHATIEHHLRTLKHPLQDKILKDLYADNLVSTIEPTTSATDYYTEVKHVFSSMNMNMTKWVSNSPALQTFIPPDDRADEINQTVLGLIWQTENDTLSFKPINYELEKLTTLTKRTALRDMARLYDPLGWATPLLLPAKLFLRHLWEKQVKWDEPLPDSLVQAWRAILTQLQQVHTILIPRKLQINEACPTLELHAFMDASAVACAVVIYARLITYDDVRLTIIAAKSRLTPKRNLSIPRLELLAVVLGTRFLNYVQTKLEWPQPIVTHLWSDSKCVISWEQTSKILPAAIAKQIKEIKSHKYLPIKYVPSNLNPADPATRGATIADLHEAQWWQGPTWLRNEQQWPSITSFPDTDIHEFLSSPQHTFFQHDESDAELQTTTADHPGVCTLDIRQFSTLTQLIKRTAFCIKAINVLAHKTIIPVQAPLDFQLALQFWLQWMQRTEFAATFQAKSEKPKNLNNIRIYFDEANLIRCQSRLHKANLPPDTINPILLAKGNPLTTLLVLDLHIKNGHAGTAHTLALLRHRYWLPQGRREIFHIIRTSCFTCHRHDASPFVAPPPSPLPEFRVNQVTRPFEVTGMDIFGPLHTRNALRTQPAKNKRWVILFTCTTTRALHLELLFNMNTKELLEAFRRFAARRGTPRLIVCDNAPQFKVMQTRFRNLWENFSANADATAYFAQQQIAWKYLPPHAPWMGGHYERLIGSIKRALHKTYGDTLLIDRQLETSLIEIEGILNSRPLTYVDKNLETPIITPNHFLNLKFPAVPLKEIENLTPTSLLHLWNASQQLLTTFWQNWHELFLMNLRDRDDKIKKRRNTSPTIPEINDIVVIAEPAKQRSSWKLARVERLIPSNDGQIRAVQLILGDRSRIVRPIIKLAPLGLSADLPPATQPLTAQGDAIIVDDTPFEPPNSQSTEDIVEIEVELDWSSDEELAETPQANQGTSPSLTLQE